MEPHETQQVAPDAGAVSVYAEPTPEQLKALLKQLESKLLSVEAENRVLKQVVAEKNYKIEALKKESQTSKKSIVEDKSALASQVFNHGHHKHESEPVLKESSALTNVRDSIATLDGQDDTLSTTSSTDSYSLKNFTKTVSAFSLHESSPPTPNPTVSQESLNQLNELQTKLEVSQLETQTAIARIQILEQQLLESQARCKELEVENKELLKKAVVATPSSSPSRVHVKRVVVNTTVGVWEFSKFSERDFML